MIWLIGALYILGEVASVARLYRRLHGEESHITPSKFYTSNIMLIFAIWLVPTAAIVNRGYAYYDIAILLLLSATTLALYTVNLLHERSSVRQ